MAVAQGEKIIDTDSRKLAESESEGKQQKDGGELEPPGKLLRRKTPRARMSVRKTRG